MYKTSLLSCTAAAAIILFNIQFSAHAENLSVANEEKDISGKTYETIYVKDKGKITGSTVTVTGNENTNTDTGSDKYVVTVEGANSALKLNGLNIQGTDSDIRFGISVKDGANINLTGGNITTSQTGVYIDGSKDSRNILQNVVISDNKNEASSLLGIEIHNESFITLENVTVKQAETGILADDVSQVIVSGGSFEGKMDGVYAMGGATITVDGGTNITSSNGNGLHAIDEKSKIIMTGGSVTGKDAALSADEGGHITVKGSTLTAKRNNPNTSINDNKIESGFGALSQGKNSVIELSDTKIKDATIGLKTQKNGAIKMTGGSITASKVGAFFLDSKSKENTLKDVKISSGNDDFLMDKGISANNSTITLNNVTVTKAKNSILADNKSQITITGGSFEAKREAIIAQNGSSITLNNGAKIISSEHNALNAIGEQSKIFMTGGTVTGSNNSLYAILGGYINVKDVVLTKNGEHSATGASAEGQNSVIELKGKTTITNIPISLNARSGGKITSEELTIKGSRIIIEIDEGIFKLPGSGAFATENSVIELNGKTTIGKVDFGLVASKNSTIKMVNDAENKIDATIVALSVESNGHIDLANTSATAGVAGVNFADLANNFSNLVNNFPDLTKNTLFVDLSQNNLKGLSSRNPQDWQNSEVNLTNTNLIVENGIGIYTEESMGKINLKNSKILADTLFKNIKQKTKPVGMFTLTADHSVLQGGVRNDENGQTRFDLKNDTKWTLKISKNEKDDDGNLLDIAQRSRSDISTLNLDNSSIVFEKPTEEHYQTLHIGSGKPDTQEVYNATGDAKIYFNTAWSDGAAINNQKTDRLLIHGDVSGNTSVYVTGRLEENNIEANTSAAANVRGLSLIQVSGKAEENSFKLVNGYTTRGGLPDMYTLRAYGPDSSQGKADIAQNLFDEKNENFWDFRLQPELLDSNSGSNPDPETNIPTVALVPQTASYLVMPNALFYSGLTDMAKQNALLANIRTSVLGKEEEKQTGFFLYTYGNTGTLSSKRGPLKYGYGADIRYAALQAGVAFTALEGQNTTTHFGLVGTYGRLSFTPKDMDDVSKSTLDKWSLTAYGSVQHDNGFYMDTLLSYGILKGDIGNAIIGKTAKLKNAKMLSISTTVGKEFATGMESLTFEPQAQLAYQHLMFNTIEDVDNFTVDMKNPSQWLIRVGGRLTKTISTENNRPMSFYGKVNLIKTFGDDGTIRIGRNFDLDPMGPAIEGGVGINAQLSHNFSLHGDVSYQQKLQKTGVSGASFSGGIRYQF
ncbi:autotransporter outer membrane beta-barrel domain-containing protein [Bartonella sp. AD13SXNS]|uniref:autotransporter outer membrane beta-barrel domain-containing protein n=1 Tax=Bartonella sp. AD13SXNS TaxID=3243462 RepID=UPI0035CF917B